MGDRGHLLRALSVAALALGGAGCLDFVEPELPERGAPAVTRLVVLLTDSGTLDVRGTVDPGLDRDGFRRRVLDGGTVEAAGRAFPPRDTAAGGGRRYESTVAVDPAALGTHIAIRGPAVSGTGGAPSVRWPALRRLDADTVRRESDGAIVLRVAPAQGTPAGPAPEIRQWFLTLTGDEGAFRLGADGAPPDSLRIPREFVPAAEHAVRVRLIYQQSGSVETVSDHIGLMTLDVRLHWTVVAR